MALEFRYGTAASATSNNPVLGLGEPGYETDTGKLKIGDGSTAWNSLPYFGAQTTSRGVLTTAAPTGTAGTDTVLMVSNALAANSLAVGSVLRIRVGGVASSTGTLAFKARLGPAGTLADNVVATGKITAAMAINQWADVDALVVVRTNGASGTCIGSFLGVSGPSLIPNSTTGAATTALDTTAVNFLTLSCSCSVGTFTAEVGTASQPV